LVPDEPEFCREDPATGECEELAFTGAGEIGLAGGATLSIAAGILLLATRKKEESNGITES
jgi:hypothetical protein